MDKYKDQCDSYIKFLMYHLIIMFTVVVALISATQSIESDKIDSLVSKVKAAKDTTGEMPEIKDYIIKGHFFDEDEVRAIPGMNEQQIETNPQDIFTKEQKSAAKQRQELLIEEVEQIMTRAFEFKLSFLGDISIDMRIWMFFLPFVFLTSIIYIFILDYKIYLQKYSMPNGRISITDRFPFQFLRTFLLSAEAVLVILYIVLIFQFFKYVSPSLKQVIYKLSALFSYYSLLYCLYVKYLLDKEVRLLAGNNFHNNNLLRQIYAFFENVLHRIKTVKMPIRFSLSQLLLLLTLFLIMTYTGCDNEYKKENLIKGYQLFFPETQWEPYQNAIMSFVMKYSYVFIMLSGTFVYILLVVLQKKNWLEQRVRLYNFLFFTALFIFILFTVYFSNFNIISLWFDLILALLLFFHWYVFVMRRNIIRVYENRIFLLIFVYLFPFLPFLAKNMFDYSVVRTGWPFFYTGLLLYTMNLFFEYAASVKENT